MTRTTLGALALLLATTGLAQAGALDRTFQPVGVLFEEGNYAELSFGFTSPDVSGVLPGSDVGSGNVGLDFDVPILSFKYDVTDRIAVAVIVEEPFGADVDYDDSDPTYTVGGSRADFRSSSVTVLGRYEFNDRFSIHGGARQVTTEADLFVNVADGLFSYDAEYESDSALGYVVGAAYERPEIALRVALTYSSETEFHNGVSYVSTDLGVPAPEASGSLDYTLPQSVNLDFRTGIAANTLLFGQVRWAEWSATEINSPDYISPSLPGNPVVGYESDIVTYTIGVGRKFTDSLSGAVSVIYEPETNSDFDADVPDSGSSNLSPTDGQLGIQVGGTYVLDSGIELTAGLRYTRLGDTTTETIGAEFEDNEAVSLGLRVGYRF